MRINQIAYYYDQNYEFVNAQGGSVSLSLNTNLSPIDEMTGIMVNGSWDVSKEEQYVYLTFRVKESNDLMYRGNINGHIAAITSYSTDEGLLDVDSGVRNIRDSGKNKDKIMDINQIQFEDDIGIAEKVKIELNSETRKISGNVFEDLNKDGNNNEGKSVNDIVVQLIEITKNNKEYIWQETVAGTNSVNSLVANEKNNHINGRKFEGMRTYTNSISSTGQYEFKDIVPGNYIVRFIYGDGYNYDITVNNTKYNGADYKSTKDKNYREEWYNNTDYFGTGLSVARDNEARRLEVMATTTEIDAGLGAALEIYAKKKELADLTGLEKENIVSYIKQLADKQDNELYAAISKAFNTTNVTTIRNTASNIKVSNLNDNYLNALKMCISYKTFMTAETSKINMPVDIPNSGNPLKSISEEFVLQCSGYQYNKGNINFPNVNFGITLRPEVKLELEKHITALKITPNETGKTIVDAKADIEKILKINKGPVSLAGETKVLQTDKSTRENRGWWKVETDVELNQGANLEVEYTYVVRNEGEKDYISKDLAKEYKDNADNYSRTLNTIVNNLKNNKISDYKIGKFLGQYYYTGNENTSTDEEVTSRVESFGEAINNSLKYDKNTSGSSFEKVNKQGETVEKTIYNVEGKKETEEIETVIETTSPSSFLTKDEKDVSKTIKLSKVLSSLNVNEGENIPSYIAEILKYSSASGVRNRVAMPGNLSYVHSKDTRKTMENSNEKDEFWGETIMIGKPTGENKALGIQIGVATTVALLTVGIGLVLIRKIVLTKQI